MAGAEKKILFSIDLEEFDLPEEYGYTLPLEEKLQVSLPGMQALDAIMDKHHAVSYTHLDVYKRQVYNTGTGNTVLSGLAADYIKR